jgi:hypothetical protein
MRPREGGVITITVHRFTEGKTVYVRSYLRLRCGQWEQVRDHFRRPPRA